MIEKNARVNGEFYIAPVYNEFIKNQGVLLPFFVEKMYGLGTPEDVNVFLRSKNLSHVVIGYFEAWSSKDLGGLESYVL